jgi:MoxR-like ATPase
LAQAVLAHRIIVNPAARLREVTPERILQEILTETPVPGGSFTS